jgi:hypothetical protein
MRKGNSQGPGPSAYQQLAKKIVCGLSTSNPELILIDKNIESLTKFWLVYRADTITAINVLKRA